MVLEERFANILPDVLITLGPEEFARLAARALAVKPQPVLTLDHLHASRVSVREQAATLVERLRRLQSATFRTLTADSPDTLTTVARFLALLELYREGAVSFEQLTPLGELSIRWTGSDDTEIAIVDEYDDKSRPADPPPAEAVTAADIARMSVESAQDSPTGDEAP